MSLTVELHKNRKPVFRANVTGNIWQMWEVAGIRDTLNSCRTTRAKDAVKKFRAALEMIKTNPAAFRQCEHPRFGKIADAVQFLEEIIRGCEEHPNAWVWGSN